MTAVQMTRAELQALKVQVGEYSASLPTGTRVGKRWLRNQAAFWRASPEPERWMIGEYVPDPAGDPTMVGIRWTRVDIVDLPSVEWTRAFS